MDRFARNDGSARFALAAINCRHPEVRALARLEGWATGVILRGSPKRLAPEDDVRDTSMRPCQTERHHLFQRGLHWRSRKQRQRIDRHGAVMPVSYTHLRAHETGRNLVCR